MLIITDMRTSFKIEKWSGQTPRAYSSCMEMNSCIWGRKNTMWLLIFYRISKTLVFVVGFMWPWILQTKFVKVTQQIVFLCFKIARKMFFFHLQINMSTFLYAMNRKGETITDINSKFCFVLAFFVHIPDFVLWSGRSTVELFLYCFQPTC